MKYQVLLLMYLLFTLPNLAQDKSYWSVTGKSNSESYVYTQSEDAVYSLKEKEQFGIFKNLELTTYDQNGKLKNKIYFDEVSPINNVVIDQKEDGLCNKYLLSTKIYHNQQVIILQKYSCTDVLQWEYSIENFETISLVPNNITILNDTEIFVSCYKQIFNSEEKQSTLYCINSEGDLLSEIAFR